MASSRLFFFFCSIFLHLVALTIEQQDKPLNTICSSKEGNFTRNSTYQTNLNHLLSSLSSNTKIDYGFYNASYGQNSNQVNAMALCRGDVKPDSCRGCIKNSTLELTKGCPNQKEAIIWYDNCMLRYSDRFFFGNMESGPWFWMYSKNNVSEANTFNQAVGTLLDSLKNKAASGDFRRKFATGNATTANSQKIYALVQCTPDLSKKKCVDCLNNVTQLLPKCCDGKQGGRVIAPSCNFRYEIDRFYDDTADEPTTSPAPTPISQPPTSISQPPASPDNSSPPATPPSPISQPPVSPDNSPPPARSPSSISQPPTSSDHSPPPATSPTDNSPPPAPASPDNSPPAMSPTDNSPPPAPASLDNSPPPTSPTDNSPPPAPESPDNSPPPVAGSPNDQSPPPSATPNSATQKGKTSHFLLVLVPLLLSQYLSSLSAYF